MSASFEELDYRPTPIGTLILRRRRDPGTGTDVFEIKLGDAFLMSSKVTDSEVALARLGLTELAGSSLDIVVGGLGLGYTAQAVLDHASVRSMLVVELFEPVADWHRDGLLPLGPSLTGDPRCRIVVADFFAAAASVDGFDPETPGRVFDAILLDIDHSPDFLLDPANAGFYTPEGLRHLTRHLRPGGVFGLWSNDPPDPAFTAILATVFAEARAEPVTVTTPLHDQTVVQTVYLARRAGEPG